MKKVKYASNKGKNIKSTEISKHDLSKKETLLLLIELSQADSKITFQRNSFGFFDLLGAIGGLKGVLSIVPAMIGSFFSSKFFSAHVADQLYIQKVKQKNKQDKKSGKKDKKKNLSIQEYLDNNFKRINISTLQLLFDPITSYLICFKSCCKQWERIKVLEKSDELFNQELNVRNLIDKLKSTYDLQKEFIKQNDLYLKYNTSRVINIETESDPDTDDPIIEPDH